MIWTVVQAVLCIKLLRNYVTDSGQNSEPKLTYWLNILEFSVNLVLFNQPHSAVYLQMCFNVILVWEMRLKDGGKKDKEKFS